MPPRPRPIPVLLALLTLLIAAGAAACGDSGGDSADARKNVKQSFEGEMPVDSGKLNLSMTAELQATGLAATQLKEPIVIRMTGPFQSRGEDKLPAMDLLLEATGSGQDFSAGAISTGDKGYVIFQGKPYAVPDRVFQRFKRGYEEQQREDNRRSNNVDLKAFGINPESWIADPQDEGEEEVGGAETTHVSGDVDLDAMLDDVDSVLERADRLGLSRQQLQQLPQNLNDRARQQIKDSVKRAKVDIWTGVDDKTLRRLELDLAFELPAELKQQAQGVEGGEIKLELEVADINEPQEIRPPANPRPWSELQRQIGATQLGSGLGGSLGGSSGGASGGSSGSNGASSRRAREYLECVQKAARPEDVNECGAILGR